MHLDLSTSLLALLSNAKDVIIKVILEKVELNQSGVYNKDFWPAAKKETIRMCSMTRLERPSSCKNVDSETKNVIHKKKVLVT